MFRVCVVLLLALVATAAAQGGNYDDVPDFDWDVETALDAYVNSDDGYYSWEEIATYRYEGVSVTVINMTSQKWMTEEYSDSSIWWHWMGIAVPDNNRNDEVGILYITGGKNDKPDEPPNEEDGENVLIATLANDTNYIFGYIRQVPNQPIVFTNDPDQKSRSEDDVIAWTWRTYLDMPEGSRDPNVILRNPMTKSVKRAFDTMTEFTGTVNRFLPSGGSKRGWTTWSIAATDDRVFASAPLVFDLLNLDETLMKHYQALAGWTFAFEAYYSCNLTQEFHNDVTQEIWDVEDMFRYRSRLTKPTLLIQATGDQFFLQHDTHYWLDGMPEDNVYLWFIANSQHSLAPHYPKIYNAIAAFCYYVDDGLEIPQLSWNRDETANTGTIRVRSTADPKQVRVFEAVTLENDTVSRRDFRLQSGYPVILPHPVIWDDVSEDVVELGGNQWSHETDKVDGEWVGHLIEMVFDGPGGFDFYQSTEVNVIPDEEWAADPCYAEGCYGELV